jgi:DNA-3-methyladenine glycosylase II
MPQRHEAAEFLRKAEPRFIPVIEQHGVLGFTQRPITFDSLFSVINGQQLSTKAADAIKRKAKAGFGLGPDDPVPPEALIGHTTESLRELGISRQKAGYLMDLATKTVEGQIHFDRFTEMPDEEIMKELIQVKGIGEWTVHMLLMFDLARPDIWPIGDLVIIDSLMKLENLTTRPKPKEALSMADKWKPYRSYASLYLWKMKDSPSPK